ncbi:unnamed protein product [Clonostachys rosea f. rosea IK726]|uniref:Uncharacterized protein n=1 Tax=Clonostachys rosea f. rosea IK726 TaxID=1349383 RepID=A0ACA9UJ14_BIOOC|nr:unnamed protein product [Clonostachys rosea f. rosea IK726]
MLITATAMKKSIACTACRASKRKCINTGEPPCDRCKGRGDECIFPSHAHASGLSSQRARAGRREYPIGSPLSLARIKLQDSAPATPSSSALAAPLDNPYSYLTDEVKSCYVRCAYKWSFHHTPSLLSSIHRQTLDHCLAWAILAIAVRFSQFSPTGYPSQIDASNAFASRARSLILPHVDEPTLQRIQVLLLLTGHSWGAGEGKRAWFYLGMSVRMAQSLGLFDEDPPSPDLSSEDFIAAEERRRTAWTCFLMDSILSGGKARDRTLSAERMNIQLPCDMDSFNFGEPVKCEMLNGSLPPGDGVPVGNLDLIGYTMRVANIWGDVAKWACASHADEPPPWNPQSSLQKLLARLEDWRASLPKRLRYSPPLLRAHSVSNQGQAYCYMHAIYHVSIICLYRSYLPEVEMGQLRNNKTAEWEQWSLNSSEELVKMAERVCEMLHEMRNFGLFFLRGLVPCVGFASYTAVGALLFFFHFPFPGAEEARIQSWRTRVVEGCDVLKEMRQAWPMADTWRNTIQRMQFFYSNIKAGGDTTVSNTTEGKALHNSVIDYGALQNSPVGQPDHSEPENSSSQGQGATPEDGQPRALPGLVMPSPQSEFSNENEAEVETEISGFVGLEPFTTDVSMLSDADMYNTMNIDMDMAVPPMFVNVSQGFWGGFSEEMET